MENNIKFILLLLLLSGCCDNGKRCCDPETSKVYVTADIKTWFPYQINQQLNFICDTNTFSASVDNISIVDGGYWQGDECPDRPGEIFKGIISFQLDTFSFETISSDQIKCTFRNESFYLASNTLYYSNLTQYTDTIYLDGDMFLNAVKFSTDKTNGLKTFYLAKNIGIVGFENDSLIFKID